MREVACHYCEFPLLATDYSNNLLYVDPHLINNWFWS